MKPKSNWWIIILVLAVLAIVLGAQSILFKSLSRETNDSLAPLKEANANLSTQVYLALHPTPTILPDPVTIIHEIRSLARLETIQYSIEKVITAEVGQGAFSFLVGDRLLFVAHGYVIAGIDLEKLTAEDLWTENGMLYARLPAPEVFVATLDNDQSYVYDRDTGILTRGTVDLETLARQAAEKEILNAAIKDGILAQASVNAENYLGKLFSQLGYKDVIFMQAETEP